MKQRQTYAAVPVEDPFSRQTEGWILGHAEGQLLLLPLPAGDQTAAETLAALLTARQASLEILRDAALNRELEVVAKWMPPPEERKKS